jgi:ribosomal-protein-alanine N-acetyltransferase
VNTLPELQFRDMTSADVDAVLGIEQQVHSHPWTRGNFADSLAAGHICKVYAAGQEIVGYAVLMPALDEVHLLDIGIATAHQRKGLGAELLDEMLVMARDKKFSRMLLEVRRSNFAANALYRKAGFAEIGVRRGYYPAAQGREDAIVMEYKLQ